MIKIRPSSCAFQKGRLTFSRYSSGCLRMILAKSHGFKEELKQAIKDTGAANEERFETQLRSTGVAYERESTITADIDSVGTDVVFSGRCDFRIGSGDDLEIVELKSTSSKNKLAELKQGIVQPEPLAQLVNYLIETGATRGRLIYTFYKNDKAAYERVFNVDYDFRGDIRVDGVMSGFTIADLLAHRHASIDVQLNQRVADRPVNYAEKFSSPCSYCPLSRICDAYDTKEDATVHNFVDSVKELMYDSVK